MKKNFSIGILGCCLVFSTFSAFAQEATAIQEVAPFASAQETTTLQEAIPFVTTQEIVDRSLVQVDDRIITLVDFEEAFIPVRTQIEAAGYGPAETETLVARYEKDIMDQMVERTITDIAVEEAGIEISDQEVDEAVVRFRESHGLSDEDFEKTLIAEGMTRERYRKQTRDQMLRSRLVHYEVRSKIVITHEDVERFYTENSERFGGGKRYRLAHILLPFSRESISGSGEDVEKKAEELKGKLQAGAVFAELAQQESASAIAGSGGDLGWFDVDALSSVIREAVENLGKGGVSAPVRTPQGFQLFQLVDVEIQPGKTLEEVSDTISDELYEAEVNERFREWILELREKVHVRALY